MNENSIPTIEEISNLFVPKKFREYFEITEVTPEKIFLKVKKISTPESQTFLEHFLTATKMTGFKVSIK